MPEKVEVPLDFHDPEFEEHFTLRTMTGTEYSEGVWLQATCRLCPSSWALHLGEYGELDKGERAAVLSHAAEHKRKGFRMRRLVR